MLIEQTQWSEAEGWQPALPAGDAGSHDLVLVFAATGLLKRPEVIDRLVARYGRSALIGCSTGGEIAGSRVFDNTLVASAIRFENTRVRTASAEIPSAADSRATGRALAESLTGDDLVHVLALSDGLSVNGSEFARGLNEGLPEGVAVTGGLSSGGAEQEETLVLYEGRPRAKLAVAVGFYGPDLRVGFGSLGGWDPFGPERLITKSRGNVLFELDGRSALSLYKRYLGEHAADLPFSALLFPLGIRESRGDEVDVRTILSIDEAEGSMTFAGNLAQGGYARFMKANFDRLVDGAIGAAQQSRSTLPAPPELAVLISCVGRKLAMQQRIEEEVEGARKALGQEAVFCGFYSNGEISPLGPTEPCRLLNQTMTVTTFSELP